MGKQWNSNRLYFLGLQNHCRCDCSHEIKGCLLHGRKVMTNLVKIHLVTAMVFLVVMYGCESCIINKNWCFWTVVLEMTLESLLDIKKTQQVHPKGDQSWVFIGRTDVEVETPIFWPPDIKNWLIWKDPDGGKDWRWEDKGITENEMVGWHHRLNVHEFEQAPVVGEGQGILSCCTPWGRKVQTWLSDWNANI